MLSPGLQKPCRVSCWQLGTSLAAAWQLRLHLLFLCLGCQSQTGNCWLTQTVWWGHPQSSPGLSWPDLSACGSCPFPMHPPYPCRGRQWNSAPSQRVPCHPNDWSCEFMDHMEAPVSPAARIISTTMPDGPSALPAFIWDSLLNHITGDWDGRGFARFHLR